MGAVWYRFGRLVRSSWRSVLALSLLVGIAGGAALGALAGARRADGAYASMVRRTDGWQVLVHPNAFYDQKLVDQIRSLPQAAHTGVARGLEMVPADVKDPSAAAAFPGAMSVLDGFGYDFGRPVLRSGRMPDPVSAHEVFVDATYADPNGIEVGDHLPMRMLANLPYAGLSSRSTPQEIDRVIGSSEADFLSGKTGQPVDLVVTGIGSTPDSVVLDAGIPPAGIWTTPAFWNAYRPGAVWFGLVATLRHGLADFPAYRDGVQAAFAAGHAAPALFQTLDVTASKVDRAVHPQAVALRIFCLVMALVGLLVVSQAISRRLATDGLDNEVLDALGATRRQRFAGNLAFVGLVAALGAGAAVAIAAAVTPLVPIGSARQMDPHAGLSVDGLVLVVGAAVVVVAIVVVATLPAWRASSARPVGAVSHPSSVIAFLARTGLGPATTTGVRFAFEPGRGRSALPVRATLVAAATGVAVAVATLTFAGSLDRLVDSPPLYGSGWDATLDYGSQAGGADTQIEARIHDALDADAAVRSWSLVTYTEVTLDGHATPSIGFSLSRRPVRPTIVAGRAPRAMGEVALASGTMADLGRHLGDHLTATSVVDGKQHDLVVVGRAVLPGVGSSSGSNKTALGQGALFSGAELAALADPESSSNLIVLTLAPGASRDQLKNRLTAALADIPGASQMVIAPVSRPSDIVALARLRGTPVLLADLLVVLVAATVANALFVAVRRRRFDLAVLRTIGETRRQLLATVAWQASATALVALAIGVPLGVVAGRTAWRALADGLGVVARPVTPWLALGLTVMVVLLLANLISLLPGSRAARTAPARILRSE